jgi:RHS repeat-associated protein
VRTDVGNITQTDFGYTGQRANSYIKLDDYHSRWYDADLGRFVSPDSIVPDAANPQSLNRYSYVDNAPISQSDPSGHCGTSMTFPGDSEFAMGCVQDVVDAISAYQLGDRDAMRLVARASGFTRRASETGNAVDQLNADVKLVFSNAPVNQRLPAAVHVGIFSTTSAAMLVGAGQLAVAGARAAAVARLQAITMRQMQNWERTPLSLGLCFRMANMLLDNRVPVLLECSMVMQ